MNWADVIPYFISSLVSFIVFYSLKKGSERKFQLNRSGYFELRMHRMYQIFGYISLVIIVFFIVGIFNETSLGIILIEFIMIILFGAMGIILLLNFRNHKVLYNHDRIIVIDRLGNRSSTYWNEITDIKFRRFSGTLKITNGPEKLILSKNLLGLNDFLRKLEEKTKWKAKDLKIPINLE